MTSSKDATTKSTGAVTLYKWCLSGASMMRFNLKLALWLMTMVVVYVSVSFWTKCSDVNTQDNNFYREDHNTKRNEVLEMQAKSAHAHLNEFSNQNQVEPLPYKEIECVINEEYTVNCRREGNEVYMPFTFISKYFEVYGKIAEYDGYERFEWRHSYSRIYKPAAKYTPQGLFMSFEHYNVEVRDRVKCISGIEGVPISTQWGPEGYFYPIQIAQYGLSHYSKYLAENTRTKIVIEEAEDDSVKWKVPDAASFVDRVYEPSKSSHVVEFDTSESQTLPGVSLHVGATSNFFISFDFRFVNNGSVSVAVEPRGKNQATWYLHYVCSQTLIHVEGNNIYHGIGERKKWSRIYRDLHTDLIKGIRLTKAKKHKSSMLHKIVSIHLRGHGFIDNLTLANNAHLAQFYYAANWLVLNQDDNGGWPIMVTRSLANGALKLAPGWVSSMGQGQAISLLVRAYVRTGNRKYLDSALRATHVFNVPSTEGGVVASFMGKYPWYEEYPTIPSCFVLNGFVYSLLGLYDLKMIAPPEENSEAERLYSVGLQSLKALLPLFDTGSGSIYDLRHFTLGVAPNLARWDYHSTHINQLLLLATIEEDPIFEQTAQRWIGYMKGKRAAHN